MADLRISELAALAGADLVAGDFVAVADISASETKKITVTDFFGKSSTLIADATIPSGKILFSSGSIAGSALVAGGVGTTQLASGAVTAAKLAGNSTVNVASTLPASGIYTGQIALETTLNKGYIWNGSQWVSFKAAGSINSVVATNVGPVNVSVATSGDAVTITAALANSTAAAQFVAGPTGTAGAVSLRPIVGSDLPTASGGAKGAVIVNGNGLAMADDVIEIDNTVTPESQAYHVVQYSGNGLITGGRSVTGNDLPLATASTVGVVSPGTGVVVTPSGALNHSNVVVSGTAAKVSFDSQGHITAALNLAASDIPEISATKITSDTLSTSVIGAQTITGPKLANFSVTRFGGSGSTEGIVAFPAADFTGQYFFDSLRGDLYLWDGNAWQPITITAGEIIFAGTYNANTNRVVSTTTAGAAAGLTVASALPAAAESNNRYYVVVAVSGTGSAPAPVVPLAPPDMLLSNGSAWQEIDVSGTVAAQIASNIAFTPAGGIAATNVQAAIVELDTEKIGTSGATITGELLIGAAGSLVFEGATADAFETTLALADPTADRVITLPNVTGTVITTGDTGTVTNTMLAGSVAYSKLTLTGSVVNADIATAAAIAYSKLALTGAVVNADIASAAAIAYSKLSLFNSIVNTDIASAAAIADTKLATIATADKVSLSALNVDGGTDIGADLADADLFIVDDGGGGTNRKAAATRISDYVFGKVTGDITVASNGTATIGSGVIVDADINASAAIVDTKLATIATAGKVSNSATTATNANTASAIVARDASGNFSAGTITAALTGNASTATSAATLTTSRNLWGQAFNGSAAVTGALTSVGDITGSGAVTIASGGTNQPLTLNTAGTGALDLNPGTGNLLLKGAAIRLHKDATNYTTLANGSITANRTLTLADGDTTLVTGTMVPTSGATLTGFLTLHAAPTSSLHAATKQYVDDNSFGYTETTTAIAKTLANNERCVVTAAGLTLTLPATPSTGFEVVIAVGNFTNTIIARNGVNIMNLAENLTIDRSKATVTLFYDGNASFGWRIV